MSFWARTVDPSFSGISGQEVNFEPVPADLVAGPPEGNNSRSMCATVAIRACRCLSVVLLLLIIWQLISHFWWQHQQPATPPLPIGPGAGVGPPPHIRQQQPPPPPPVIRSDGKEVAPVPVTVYYEALCPDSKTFIVDQLWPAYRRIPDILHITLVPYGKAKTQYHVRELPAGSDAPPPVTFSCQHGAEECWGNKVHACGIRQADSQQQALSFVMCLMKYFSKMRKKAPECAELNSLQWREIASCAEDEEINRDMVLYGNMTHSLRPPLHFIPTITANNSQDKQGDLLLHFLDFVCTKYTARAGLKPDGCP